MNIKLIQTFEDGSGWNAIVEVKGLIVIASFTEKLNVQLAPYTHPQRAPKWVFDYVRKWAETEIDKLGSDWIKKNREMYA